MIAHAIRQVALPAATVGSLLALGAVAAPSAAQPPRIVKSEEGEPLKVDESGLTRMFAAIKNMTRHVDVETIDGKQVEVHAGKLPTMGPDYEAFLALDDGLLEFQTTAAIKLRTAAELRFGQVTLGPGNVAPDYPGLYSLWLRRSGDSGWTLIFNDEADAWGTMHDASHDVGRVPLRHEIEEGAKASFSIDLDQEAGTLTLAWGEHVWTTAFGVG